jgi:hypothetical protein
MKYYRSTRKLKRSRTIKSGCTNATYQIFNESHARSHQLLHTLYGDKLTTFITMQNAPSNIS